MKQLPISVIVPVYNVEEYLAGCIESILRQTFSSFELILVDDGATDDSARICERYAEKDARIKVSHKENGGLSSARNAGIEAATGLFFTFVDSDDCISPDCLEKMILAAEEFDADVVVGAYRRMNREGILLEETSKPSRVGLINGGQAMEELFEDNAVYYIIACGKLYRRNLFSSLRFPRGKIHEDEAVIHRIYCQAHRVYCLEDILYLYRINEKSITHRKFDANKFDANDAYYNRFMFIRTEYGDGELAQKAFYAYFLRFLNNCRLAATERPVGWREKLAVEGKRMRESWRYAIKKSGFITGDKRIATLGAIHPRLAVFYLQLAKRWK